MKRARIHGSYARIIMTYNRAPKGWTVCHDCGIKIKWIDAIIDHDRTRVCPECYWKRYGIIKEVK